MEFDNEETEINEQEDSATALTTSLFPIFAARQPQHQQQTQNDAAAGWLTNSSFTTDLTIINDAVASLPQESDTESQQEHEKQREPPKYTIISDEFEERNRKKKSKKKRKHRSSDDDVDSSYGSRKVSVRAKDYYFDTHGDRDNLVYGSLYRMDVPRYKLYNRSGIDIKGMMYRLNWRGDSLLEKDGDVDALDANLKSAGRYWSAKYAVVEQHKNLKRLRVLANKRHAATADYASGSDGFIPFVDTQVDAETAEYFPTSQVAVVEESWEDEVLRKTREFNKLTREQPHNEKVWLDFADFQDKIASKQRQKGARLQTLEKKISVLEKAAELNPDNEELLLHLVKAYQSRDSTDVLMGRWEKILMSHSSSVNLWKEFLHVIQGEFSRFKVSETRKMFSHAIRALYGACNRKIRQVHQNDKPSTRDLAIIQLELGLVEVFVSLCRLEWKTGYRELATALFQAELEFCLFCPSLLLSENSKLRLFEYFWSSGCPRVGEEGANGWSTWLEKEEESRQSVLKEDTSHDDKGGWTGWSEPLSDHKASDKNNEDSTTDNLPMEEVEEELQKENISFEGDTEMLLKQLGIDVAAGDDTEVSDTSTWTRWSQEELSRDCNQWMPVRGKHDKISENAGTAEADDDEQISRVILYEDVSEYLFSLSSEEARLSLVSQFVEFFGGQITHGISTNSSIWTENILSLEELPNSILQNFKSANGNLAKSNSSSSRDSLELISISFGDGSKRTDMMKFLRNALLLCLSAFPRNYILEEAILIAEEQSVMRMESSIACRALAKSLLKSDRQDVLLCGVYAKREAGFGNIDHARRIFDMALLSVEGLPMELQHNASLLYFWYAEMELSNSSEESSSRALHILSCLGSGKSYVQFQSEPSKLQLLVAHQGFKERIKTIRSTWIRGVIDDQSIALICSAALFEELTSGWTSGIAVLEDASSMVLPDRRSNSYQLEFLFRYYVKMLQRHHKESGLSKVWEAILQGLQIYPSSLELYMDLTEIGKLYTTPNKLRWIFDDFCQKKPSVIATICSLSFEMSRGGRGGSEHRVHGLFERALSDERLHNSVVLWRLYIAYEINIACNLSAAKRIFFRAIHACPWSKTLWLDGFSKLSSILTAKELSDLQEVMREKELNLRTDIYEILLQQEDEHVS